MCPRVKRVFASLARKALCLLLVLCMASVWAFPVTLALADDDGDATTAAEGTASGGSDESAHVHMSITADKSSYSAGSLATVSFKYTVDQGAVSEGDYILVSVPEEIASSVSLMADPLHFSQTQDLGGGTYKLVFGSGAATALTGTFSAYVSLRSDLTSETMGSVSSCSASASITVVPAGSATGTSGTYMDSIMKDALTNDGQVIYKDYDYSEGYGDSAAQIGVCPGLSESDQTIGYRLFINDKLATMSGVQVVDTLPDGMSFDTTHAPEVLYRETGKPVDPSEYQLAISGDKLTFTYPGTLTQTVQINYWAVAGQGKSVKYTNRAEIVYESDGTTYQEHRNYVLQSSDYSAASGEKSVDKAVVTNDPDDQTVVYTLRFWNSNGFSAGEINLVDALDPEVAFLYAQSSDSFSVAYDEATHAVRITNTAALSSSGADYVRFAVDFTNVRPGRVVTNTAGGNTTKTTKEADLVLTARKTVDGAAPGDGLAGRFSFELLDADGNVLQTKTADAGGDVTFDGIEYGEQDVGKTFSYKVVEAPLAEDLASAYEHDATVYDVSVTPTMATDDDGASYISAEPTITVDGSAVDAITFEDASKTPTTPTTPTTPETPTTPTTPDTPATPPTPSAPTPSQGEQEAASSRQAASALPKTGDETRRAALAFSLALALMGAAVLLARRRLSAR
ncbi:MAG: LPXTG cell wall anchor domain-containing protein [Atopobiaceae bacterium]|nr:LPXTG cell wall anchor domain-containing protein [Atopobiaceae bacterium]MCI1388460.1 LPXTG cell wall anchor domain-containing protein [Atopobiaceae bacterium]MCI1431959.1 LPXTG cell wall anchor domain-containing protein [Atopobiaceae bacterium]MCI1470417.1 LPXTG cell wall anchor domain-containing protein [Atopobiaceae bacterium]